MSYRSLAQYSQAIKLQERNSSPQSSYVPKITLLILLLGVIGLISGGVWYWQKQHPSTTYIAKTYYISSTGNDINNGTSLVSAWKTIDKVNRGAFRGGDSILFEGGKHFVGNIELYEGVKDPDNPQPITIGSFGQGNAIIDAGNGRAITVQNRNNVTIENLTLIGKNSTCANDNNGLFITATTTRQINHITVKFVETSGFCNGIAVLGKTDQSKFGDLTLNHVVTHDNLGNGILLRGVDNARISNSTAFSNGKNVPCMQESAGIFALGNHITIENNEIFQQGDLSCGEGKGVMLSGLHNLVQYNYTHNNTGASLSFTTTSGNSDVIVRYNISENDATDTNKGVISLVGGLSNVEVYNNTLYTNRTDSNRGPVIVVDATSQTKDVPDHIHFRNNIFLTFGNAQMLHVTDPESMQDLLFQNNTYYDQRGSSTVSWGKKTFNSMADWANQTSQERVGNTLALKVTDPLLCNIGHGGTVYPKTLDHLKAYKIMAFAPSIDQGIDVWGMQIAAVDFRSLSVTKDFFGNTVPTGSTYDIGANEFINGQVCE